MIRKFSERIVSAKEPVEVLDGVKWGDTVERAFFKSGCKELPHVRGPEFYAQNPLKFDPDKKINEFNEIERDISRELGQFNNVGALMQRMCREYCTVIEMLKARGTPHFARYAKQLYGSSGDTFYAGSPTLNDLAVLISNTLSFIATQTEMGSDQKIYTSEEAANILGQRLSQYFEDEGEKTYVKVSDDLTADAAMCPCNLKI